MFDHRIGTGFDIENVTDWSHVPLVADAGVTESQPHGQGFTIVPGRQQNLEDGELQLVVNPIYPWSNILIELPRTYTFPLFADARGYVSPINSPPPANAENSTCTYSRIRQTICPVGTYATDYLLNLLSPSPIAVRLLAQTDFILASLGHQTSLNSSVTSPAYLEIVVDDAVVAKQGAPLEIRIYSTNPIPGLIQVEVGGCSKMDVLQASGSFTLDTLGQTMLGKGFIRIDDWSVPTLETGQWFVKLSVLPQEADQCQDFEKDFTVDLRVGLSYAEYTLPVVVSSTVFLLLILIFLFYFEIARKNIMSQTQLRLAVAESWDGGEGEQSLQGGSPRVVSSSTSPPATVTAAAQKQPGGVGLAHRNSRHGSGSGGNFRSFSSQTPGGADSWFEPEETEHTPLLQRQPGPLHVSDLNIKSYEKMKKYDLFYLTMISTVCIFYGLPLVQTSLYNQVVVNQNLRDLCFFNFFCAHRLGPLRAFNNVISNNGFVLLGLAFIFIVHQRASRYSKEREEAKRAITLGVPQECGLPRFYHLYYALGLSTVTEGIYSGLYALCPNKENSQFDSSLMILIYGLMLLILYQKRHPDLRLHPMKTFVLFGVMVLFNTLSAFVRGYAFWGVALFCVIVFTSLGSLGVYYLGQWKWTFAHVDQLSRNIRSGTGPQDRPLFVLLLLFNIMNWGAFIL